MRYLFTLTTTIIISLLSNTYAQNSAIAIIKKYSTDENISVAFEQWKKSFEKDSTNINIAEDGIVIIDNALKSSQEKRVVDCFIKTSIDFLKLSLKYYKEEKISAEKFTQDYIIIMSVYDRLSSLKTSGNESKRYSDKRAEVNKLFLDSKIQNCMIINNIEGYK